MGQNGHPPGKSLADHYVAVALKIIDLADRGGHLKSPEDLRSWWGKERAHRDEYGLSEAHEKTLIQACAAKVREMEGQANSQSTRSATPKRRVAI